VKKSNIAPFSYTVCPVHQQRSGWLTVLTIQAELEERLRDDLPALGIRPDNEQTAALVRFLHLLDKWNRVFNLTAIGDVEDMVALHVLDSLSALPFLQGISILDVGTGAGLPGIPLALVQERRQFALLDSGGKKTRFVKHALGELGIENVTVVQSRVEDYEPADAFDTVICRAFTSLGDFARRCGALVASTGRLVAMKGRFPERELKEVPVEWQVLETTAVEIPGLSAKRHIVVLQRK